jgi:hypothetical protein
MNPELERDTEPAPAPPAVLYASLVNELHEARAAAGGALSEDDESAFAERLDDLWWELTDEEQDDYLARGGS